MTGSLCVMLGIVLWIFVQGGILLWISERDSRKTQNDN